MKEYIGEVTRFDPEWLEKVRIFSSQESVLIVSQTENVTKTNKSSLVRQHCDQQDYVVYQQD